MNVVTKHSTWISFDDLVNDPRMTLVRLNDRGIIQSSGSFLVNATFAHDTGREFTGKGNAFLLKVSDIRAIGATWLLAKASKMVAAAGIENMLLQPGAFSYRFFGSPEQELVNCTFENKNGWSVYFNDLQPKSLPRSMDVPAWLKLKQRASTGKTARAKAAGVESRRWANHAARNGECQARKGASAGSGKKGKR